MKSIITYCERFPTALVRICWHVSTWHVRSSVARPWKYDPTQSEFFVESSTRQTIRTTEIRRQQEIQERSAAWLHLQLSRATLTQGGGMESSGDVMPALEAPAVVSEAGLAPLPERMGEKAGSRLRDASACRPCRTW